MGELSPYLDGAPEWVAGLITLSVVWWRFLGPMLAARKAREEQILKEIGDLGLRLERHLATEEAFQAMWVRVAEDLRDEIREHRHAIARLQSRDRDLD